MKKKKEERLKKIFKTRTGNSKKKADRETKKIYILL